MKKILSILLIIMVALLISLTAFAHTSYTVTASKLNIRKEPNTYCTILGTVTSGTVLKGEASINGWTPIVWNGNKAYVWSAYITPKQETSKTYSQSDVDLLSRVINAEAGSSWLSDEHQLAVGSVVLNRVADSRFPNTIRGVVYQKGQYACAWNGMLNTAPSERAIKHAKYLLKNGVTIPKNVVWQSQCKQGNGVWKYIQGHYFCY